MVEENPLRGIYSVETQSFGKVGFKFGMNAWYLFTDKMGIGLNEMQKVLEKGDLKMVIYLLHSASKAYSIYKKEEFTLDEFDMGDIIDEIGLQEAMDLLTVGMSTFGADNGTKKKKKVKDKPLPGKKS